MRTPVKRPFTPELRGALRDLVVSPEHRPVPGWYWDTVGSDPGEARVIFVSPRGDRLTLIMISEDHVEECHTYTRA